MIKLACCLAQYSANREQETASNDNNDDDDNFGKQHQNKRCTHVNDVSTFREKKQGLWS